MLYPLSDYLYKTATYLFSTGEDGSLAATGFFFLFDGQTVPIVITNRHVVEGKSNVIIQMRSNKEKSSIPLCVNIFPHTVHYHPDDSVDLACIKLQTGLVTSPNIEFDDFYFCSVLESMIPTNKELESFHYIEDIIMFGTPVGIWDKENAFPIARKGITATSVNAPFMGESKFCVDIGSYPGSSGSPIFLGRDEALSTIDKAKILGVFCKAQFHDLEVNKDDNEKIFANEYIHMGQAIPSTKILDFKSFI